MLFGLFGSKEKLYRTTTDAYNAGYIEGCDLFSKRLEALNKEQDEWYRNILDFNKKLDAAILAELLKVCDKYR